IWARFRPGRDVEEWARRGREYGVAFETALAYSLDGQPRPFARLGFGSLAEKELREAVVRMARARPIARRCGWWRRAPARRRGTTRESARRSSTATRAGHRSCARPSPRCRRRRAPSARRRDAGRRTRSSAIAPTPR